MLGFISRTPEMQNSNPCFFISLIVCVFSRVKVLLFVTYSIIQNIICCEMYIFVLRRKSVRFESKCDLLKCDLLAQLNC